MPTEKPPVPSSSVVPFPILAERNPVELLLTHLQLIRVEPALIQSLSDWLQEKARELDPKELREPNLKLHYFFQHATAVIRLAHENWPLIEARAKHYGLERLEGLAHLIVATRLIERFRHPESLRTSAPLEVSVIGEARGWSVVQDAIRDLGEVEERLVTLGAAALIDHPHEQALLLEDDDDGSFRDAFYDVRRRVEMARNYPSLFEAVGIDSGELNLIEQLLQDAEVFYQDREATSVSSEKLTRLRDLALTLSLIELKKLQYILRAVLGAEPTTLKQIEGKFWSRLNRLSRKRRKRKESNNDPTPPSPNDPNG